MTRHGLGSVTRRTRTVRHGARGHRAVGPEGLRSCEISSDVDGIYTADPYLFGGARLVQWVSYRDAHALAAHGAKVPHPRAVEAAEAAGVVILCCLNHGDFRPGSVISAHSATHAVVLDLYSSRTSIFWLFSELTAVISAGASPTGGGLSPAGAGEQVAASYAVAMAGSCLVPSSPSRPFDGVIAAFSERRGSCQETADLGRCAVHEVGCVLFTTPFSRSAVAMAARKAWASMARVMCRYQLV